MIENIIYLIIIIILIVYIYNWYNNIIYHSEKIKNINFNKLNNNLKISNKISSDINLIKFA